MAATNMTLGSPTKHLIQFAIPLILSNVFQLTYNAVDSILAGRLIGKDALAATGTASPVMNLIILGISGLCMGAGVIMSEFFGAGDYERLRHEVTTTLILGLLFSVAILIPGLLFTVPLLRLLNVPEEMMALTTLYLRIVLFGAPFTYFYNALAAALKSVGDTKTPLKFLMLSSVINVILDLLFIGLLGLGIAGAAIATVVAEALSAALSMAYIYKKIPILRFTLAEFRLDSKLLRTTLQYGSMTALQQSCQPIGKLMIQSSVNSLGVNAIAAFNAVTRVDDFACIPEQSISHGITTYVAQNRGAHKESRILYGFGRGMLLEFCYGLFICSVVLLLNRQIMGLFISEETAEAIVAVGCQYLTTMAFFYILPAFNNGMQGFFRGLGKIRITLIGTLIQISLRVLFTFLLVPNIGIYGISFACAIGWGAMLVIEGIVLLKEIKSRKHLS